MRSRGPRVRRAAAVALTSLLVVLPVAGCSSPGDQEGGRDGGDRRTGAPHTLPSEPAGPSAAPAEGGADEGFTDPVAQWPPAGASPS